MAKAVAGDKISLSLGLKRKAESGEGRAQINIKFDLEGGKQASIYQYKRTVALGGVFSLAWPWKALGASGIVF